MHLMASIKEPDSPDQKAAKQINIQSKTHETLLNTIDQLRSQGISRFIDLPQLIVCGDQSSGKSSVLEAVSGIKFPTKDALCTRFATELILRRSSQTSTTVTIVPDANRDDDEKEQLQAFRCEAKVNDDFGGIIEQAGKAMGLDGSSKNFSTDVLRIEVSGPTQPHLTLVDLPGLFHVGSLGQSDDDAEAVKELVTGYMKKPRSIILAVVSAKNDFNNQIVTKYAKDYDKGGKRTLGIITKPDTLDAGSDSETQFFRLAQNKDVEFQLGWHVLKNREYKERGFTNAQRDASEKAFFEGRIWASLGQSKIGIDSLRPRLSEVLQGQILKELPDLFSDVKAALQDCQWRLSCLGPSRGTVQEQRIHLHTLSEAFTSTVKDAIRGKYDAEFFGNAATDEGYARRIRAVTANLLAQFADDIRLRGHRYQIVKSIPPRANDEDPEQFTTPMKVTKEERVEQVAQLLRRSRGTELPGFFKEDTITTLFKDQCSPWVDLIHDAAEAIFASVRYGVLASLQSICDPVTLHGLLGHIINPKLEEIKSDFDEAVKTTLEQHIHGQPVTFNHYFTENVQKLRNEHNAEHMAKILTETFGADPRSDDYIVYDCQVNTRTLLKSLSAPSEADMNRFACSEALYFMQAYYKVAKKFFIDDFATHAVEQTLLAQIDKVFSPSQMFSLRDDVVSEIAGETEESKLERHDVTSKLKALKAALEALKKFDRGQGRGGSIATNAPTLPNLGGNFHAESNESDDEEILVNGRSALAIASSEPAPLPEDDWGSLSMKKKKKRSAFGAR